MAPNSPLWAYPHGRITRKQPFLSLDTFSSHLQQSQTKSIQDAIGCNVLHLQSPAYSRVPSREEHPVPQRPHSFPQAHLCSLCSISRNKSPCSDPELLSLTQAPLPLRSPSRSGKPALLPSLL